MLSCVTIDNGLSVVAIDKESGKVCGGFTGMDGDMSVIPIGVGLKMIPSIIKGMRMMPRGGEFMEVID